jgi:hypothetical protein
MGGMEEGSPVESNPRCLLTGPRTEMHSTASDFSDFYPNNKEFGYTYDNAASEYHRLHIFAVWMVV